MAAWNPLPTPQEVTVTSSHDDVEDPGLNDVPATHVSHDESAVEVPAIKPSPVAQFALVCFTQPFVDDDAVNDPSVHAEQVESATVVPATNPRPLLHGLFVWGAHAFMSVVAEK